jgi:hypothetical protein
LIAIDTLQNQFNDELEKIKVILRDFQKTPWKNQTNHMDSIKIISFETSLSEKIWFIVCVDLDENKLLWNKPIENKYWFIIHVFSFFVTKPLSHSMT